VVVDDGSEDGTAEAASVAGARVLRHRGNRGYGASLKTGIRAASHEIIAITDADGTYPGEYIPKMLELIDRADMVVGARIGKNVRIPAIRRPAKWVLNRLADYVSGARIPDLNSGLRLFRREMVLQYFPILPDQFSFTTTITLAMHCDKYAVRYVPIDYRPRTGKSKIMPWDAGSFAVLILRTAMLFKPLRVFLPVVAMCLGYGVLKSCVDLLVGGDRNISATAIFAFLAALLVLMIGMLGDAVATRLGKLTPNAVLSAAPSDVTEMAPRSAPGSEGR
jgi:glycosyltransferase involved in cell wall biosynthesis